MITLLWDSIQYSSVEALHNLIPFRKKYDTNVGWVEGRNPTPQSLVIVGFHSVQPNLRICFIFFWNWYNKPGNLIQQHQKKVTLKLRVTIKSAS